MIFMPSCTPPPEYLNVLILCKYIKCNKNIPHFFIGFCDDDDNWFITTPKEGNGDGLDEGDAYIALDQSIYQVMQWTLIPFASEMA